MKCATEEIIKVVNSTLHDVPPPSAHKNTFIALQKLLTISIKSDQHYYLTLQMSL